MNEIINVLENANFQDKKWMLIIPFSMMIIDILTGIVYAWKTGHLKSYKMREGLSRKFGEVMILFIGQLFTAGFNLPVYVISMFAMYIIAMELISICENLKKLGVPIPKAIDKALASVNDTIQNGSNQEDNKK